jgi:hypothetical protein
VASLAFEMPRRQQLAKTEWRCADAGRLIGGARGAVPAAVSTDFCMALAKGSTKMEWRCADAAEEEELDRRAEDFSSTFRHRLRVDSFSSSLSGSR